MADQEEQEPVKSVSSLRSRFEQLVSKNSSSTPTTPAPVAPPNGDPFKEQPNDYRGRASLDIRRPAVTPGISNGRSSADTLSGLSPQPPARPQNPRQRPLSVGHFSTPPRQLPTPTVRVESPKSPPKLNFSTVNPRASPGPGTPLSPAPRDSAKPPSRPTSPSRFHTRQAPPLPPSRPARLNHPDASSADSGESHFNSRSVPGTPVAAELPQHSRYPSPGSRIEAVHVSPKIDRPRPPGPKPFVPPKRTDSAASSLAVHTPIHLNDRNSPFSTPPGSNNNSPEHEEARQKYPVRNVPPVAPLKFPPPPTLTPTPQPQIPSRRSSERVKQPPPPPPIPDHRPSLNLNPSYHSQNAPYKPRKSLDEPPVPPPPRKSMDESRPSVPSLPPRTPLEPPRSGQLEKPKIGSIRGRSHSPPKQNPLFDVSGAGATFLPPPQRAGTIKGKSPQREEQKKLYSQSTGGQRSYGNDDSDESETGAVEDGLSDYPDASQANRRRPYFHTGPKEIICKSEVKLFAVCGQYVCTASGSTKVWDLMNQECIMAMHHGEGTRITAIAFKPSAKVEEEGSRLWLGTSTGELIEIDIQTQRIVETRSSAHTKKEVVKIHRRGYDLWTLDESGKLQVWPPDHTGVPNLRNSPTTFRILNKHGYSIVVGSQLWVTTGKGIYVYEPASDARAPFNVLARPLVPNKPAGDITCGATLNSEPDKVYFGHSDGKVSVYSRSSYVCLEVVNVSLYKINSMAGVGEFLWVGFKTGMMYVYDVQSRPWRVAKDWDAHGNPILEVIADRTSIWKIDRLQVVSLGMDNVVRIWDGMLEEDWLEGEMQRLDMEFCQFRELKALVCTWNAGATKPSDLMHSADDQAFIEHLLQSADDPDIITFGFQELVDLEDKKLTAKSILKGKSKKSKSKSAAYQAEHMSHQYRLWKEYLTKCIERHLPGTPYYLVHAADMVGLFTCVFIKASEQSSINNVAATAIKRGLGGLHGNKGALIVRFMIDDSSICFVNCHLAAGQSHTSQRNNDIAGILESNQLPVGTAPSRTGSAARTDLFVCGGDGSMILDHEITILNGDLNYRIDMQRDNCINHIRKGDLALLWEKDQLNCERKRNPGFRLRAFQERRIEFAPTYKYDVNSDQYDTSEKKRVPAWCDRLLYRGYGKIKQVEYRRHEVRASDHRPVSGIFLMRVKTVVPEKREAVWAKCVRRYEKVKLQSVYDAKLDFLVNVCGYDVEQARATLGKRQKNPIDMSDAVKMLQQQEQGY